MRTSYIYCLKDPNTLAIRYIGQTLNIKSRLSLHIHGSKTQSKKEWIESLKIENKKPIIEVMEQCDQSISTDRERHHISRAMQENIILLNHNSPGGGNRNSSNNKRKNISYTLDEKNIEDLAKAATKLKVSASWLLNDILSKCKKIK